MNQQCLAKVKATFQSNFNTIPTLFSAPGRINILGEHTDYNDGLVLPAAVDKRTYIALAESETNITTLIASDLDERLIIDSSDELKPRKGHWSNYILGVIAEFKKLGIAIPAMNCVFGGDIPIGAGMSSSAALECGIASGLNHICNLGFDKMQLARLGQAAEHNFVGVKCGIMDQFASMFGKENSAIELNCKTMEYKYHPSNFNGVSLLLFDTCVHHSLGDSAYNQRREECESGVAIIQSEYPEVSSLGDATYKQLVSVKEKLAPIVFQRCEYIIKEIERVQIAAEALEKGNFAALGHTMYATHEGLSKAYEVSCAELDFLVDQSMNINEIYGARMMGGGFGGCTLNLVSNDLSEQTVRDVKAAYAHKFGHEMKVYPVNIADGAGIVED